MYGTTVVGMHPSTNGDPRQQFMSVFGSNIVRFFFYLYTLFCCGTLWTVVFLVGLF